MERFELQSAVEKGILKAGKHSYTVATEGVPSSSFTITNTLVNPTRELLGSIVWDDADNKDKIRPDSVQMRLVRNGVPTDQIKTITSQDPRAFSFKDLPTFDDHGETIIWSIESLTAPQGYEVRVSGDMESGFTIVYRHEPARKKKRRLRWILPKTGDTVALGGILSSAAALSVFAAALHRRRKHGRK
ncbi:Cna B-type domain-containing protein [Collinsella sp. AGMB00827]|uniref:Cna B-type domain-containing protein n=1 Tax=Collinsella ureilytica TaxID=2869515 RepID=A0ABS7MLY1_9ACTN|nr:Cna B-type domain-containing protein [Collinsella urealyticum]